MTEGLPADYDADGLGQFPADVQEVARDLMILWPTASPYTVQRSIALAVMAERERCAKVAEAHDLDPEYAEWIAKAIRQSPNPAQPLAP